MNRLVNYTLIFTLLFGSLESYAGPWDWFFGGNPKAVSGGVPDGGALGPEQMLMAVAAMVLGQLIFGEGHDDVVAAGGAGGAGGQGRRRVLTIRWADDEPFGRLDERSPSPELVSSDEEEGSSAGGGGDMPADAERVFDYFDGPEFPRTRAAAFYPLPVRSPESIRALSSDEYRALAPRWHELSEGLWAYIDPAQPYDPDAFNNTDFMRHAGQFLRSLYENGLEVAINTFNVSLNQTELTSSQALYLYFAMQRVAPIPYATEEFAALQFGLPAPADLLGHIRESERERFEVFMGHMRELRAASSSNNISDRLLMRLLGGSIRSSFLELGAAGWGAMGALLLKYLGV